MNNTVEPRSATHPASRSRPTVSVVLRNRNEATHMELVLAALSRQSERPYEIVVVDNESSDSSIAVAERYHARIVQISRAQFTYGRALNVGIGAAGGELIMILSAHSLPVGPYFITSAVNAIEETGAAAVRCRNIRLMDNHVNWSNRCVIQGSATWDDILHLTIENPASLLRRSVWEQLKFREDVDAEDRYWSADVLNAGYKIATSDAFYFYMRRPTFAEDLRRFERVITSLYPTWGQVEHSSLMDVVLSSMQAWRTALRSTLHSLARYALLKALPLLAKRGPRVGSVR